MLPVATIFRMGVIRGAMYRSCMLARGVMVQTNTMRRAVVEAFRLQEDAVRVFTPFARLAARGDERFRDRWKDTPPDRRLVYVGSWSKYKNVERVFRALRIVRKLLPEARLFITWPASACPASDGIVSLGVLAGGELRELYEGATALILPSLVETVGLPMLEAASMGCPVIAADRPYAREICGKAAEYFDPLSEWAIAEAILRVLSDARRREELSRLGRERSATLEAAKPYDQMMAAVLDWGAEGA